MKKSSKAIVAIASVLLLLASFAGAAVSAFAYVNTTKLNKAIEQNAAELKQTGEELTRIGETVDEIKKAGEDEGKTQENDVCIAGEYFIRDTTAISDAYKSGDTSKLDDRQKETLKMASDILDKIIEDGMDPYECEKTVYTWLTTELKNDTGILTVIPTSQQDSDNPYGVLKYRNAVCVGYATTFRLFMHMLDIECMVVHNTECYHSWDLVTLDGERYHVDCYFDSEQNSYRHFNLSDDLMGQDHNWDRSFFPKATGVKYNYNMQNAVEIEDIYAIPAFVREKVDADEACFSCTFKDLPKEDEAAAIYIVNRVIGIVNMNYSDRDLEYYWAEIGEGSYMLCFTCDFYEEDPGTVIDDDHAEKAEDSIEDAFGDMDTTGEYVYGDPGDYTVSSYYFDETTGTVTRIGG